MELTLPRAKELMKQHKISGRSFLNKAQMISLLIEKGVLSREDLSTSKNYDRLKRIRKNPKRVEILDKETGVTTTYRSIYSAAQAFNQNPGFIAMFNGKVYKKRYEIKVCEEKSTSSDESTCVTESDESSCVTSSEEESTSGEEEITRLWKSISSDEENTRTKAVTGVTAAVMKVQAVMRKAVAALNRKI